MIKVMSFNIRVGHADDGVNHWENRKELVINRIQGFSPDLLGLQECRDDAQAEFIRRKLRDYHFYGVPRGGSGDTRLEMAPVLFKKTAFKLRKSGCFWLSTTPDLAGSKGWDSVFARTATWVELEHRPSGRVLLYLNTHFDYQPVAIEESARLLAQWVGDGDGQIPLVITGDFNADKNSVAYKLLTAGGILSDVFRQQPSPGTSEGTFHDYGRSMKPAPIDWILVSPHFEVSSAQVDRFQDGLLFPSDHYPVLAELHLKSL